VSVWGIVTSGGRGVRFGGPKHLRDLGGRRLVDRAVDSLAACCDGVVVVLPAGTEWDGPPVEAVVVGGEARADSVRAGLAAVPLDAEIVVVHGPSHPLAGPALVEAVIAAVRAGADGAVPVMPANDTVLHVTDGVVTAAEPGPLVLAQTPFAFAAGVLRAAHADAPPAKDDVSLLVARGARVVTVPGHAANLHVTTPDELAIAEGILGLGGRGGAPGPSSSGRTPGPSSSRRRPGPI
jgi:2-C-methyl-D-erythritol 4-phosphate cytidylyltransferase